jgi:hypothetical protein
MAIHPAGRRPRSWFGPDDWNDGDDPDEEIANVRKKQQAWDAQYVAMPWWKRVLSEMLGEVTEPVHSTN